MARKLLPATDLASRFPAVAGEWDHEKNYPLTPDQIAGKSGRKVWWKCNKGHSWPARIVNRSNGTGCPYCAGKLPVEGETDLASIRSDLLFEWDYEKNKPLTPQTVTAFSSKKIWWKCNRGHSWKATVQNRTRNTSCPYCARQLPIEGETDFATICDKLLPEWDYEKNKPLIPQMVTAFSHKKAWWKCDRGHSWKTTIYTRTLGSECPYCTGKLPIEGKTDFATVCSELLSEWDYEKNKILSPQMVTSSSHKKVWWKCEQGHSWKVAIYDRSKGSKCPYCAGKLPVEGETDLATVCSQIASEWDYDKNKSLTPQMVGPRSNKIVYWRCNMGHSWKAMINSRFNGNNCPYCAGKFPIEGETDFTTTCSYLLPEWDYERNAPLKPQKVSAFSSRKVWWKCKCGNGWKATISSRVKGTGCPECRYIKE